MEQMQCMVRMKDSVDTFLIGGHNPSIIEFSLAEGREIQMVSPAVCIECQNRSKTMLPIYIGPKKCYPFINFTAKRRRRRMRHNAPAKPIPLLRRTDRPDRSEGSAFAQSRTFPGNAYGIVERFWRARKPSGHLRLFPGVSWELLFWKNRLFWEGWLSQKIFCFSFQSI